MNRKDAREAVFCTLFGWEFIRECDLAELWERTKAEGSLEDDEYADTLIQLLRSHIDEIEETVAKYAVGWKLNRISAVSRAALCIGICEMFYMPSVPLAVSLNEAIELTKKFDDEKAYVFVNGVLNAAKADTRAVQSK